MIKQIDTHIKELELMKKYPSQIFYIGNLSLLENKKVSIVGSRKPNQYSKQLTHQISSHVIYKNKYNSTRINITG